jgi:NAD(P) transhydrogenase subunit beta
MFQGLVTVAYILAAILFILSLGGLSKQETAKKGNLYGITGMAIALVTTIANADLHALVYILLAMLVGSLIGARLALKVEMTGMPELVACLHSFVGLAAVLVGYNSFFRQQATGSIAQGSMLTIEMTEIFLGVFIGAVTFTGSIVAFGKLRGAIKSRLCPCQESIG